MRTLARLCLLVLTIVVLDTTPVVAKRVALVIGIDAYDSLPDLQRAVNDARYLGGTLSSLGFSVVEGENLSRQAMNRKLAEIEKIIAPGDTAFFFFAGHGVAIGGENLLLAADMPSPSQGEEGLVREEGFTVEGVVRRLQARGAQTTLMVIDACRDNPFEAAGTRDIGLTRGLARVEAPAGVFVLFSAGIGQTALDRLPNDDDANSVFTRMLVPALQTPGLSHVAVAKKVQREVGLLAASVNHKQQPAYYDQIDGEIFLNGTSVNEIAAIQPPGTSLAEEAKVWSTIEGTTSCGILDSFIARYPSSIYADFARVRQKELKCGEESVAVAVTAPPTLEGTDLWAACKGNDFDLVVELCTKLIDSGSLNPVDKASALGSRGWGFKGRGEYDKALADWQACATETPQDAYCPAGFADLAFAQANYDEAIKQADIAIDMSPKYTWPIAIKGASLRMKGLYDPSIEALDQAIKIDPRYTYALYQRGLSYSNKEDYKKAISDYSKALLIDKTYNDVRSSRAYSYFASGNIEKATADIDKVIQNNPSDHYSWALRGYMTVLQESADAGKSAADFDKAIVLSSNVDWYYTYRALANIKLGKLDLAKADLDRTLAKWPKAIEDNTYLGMLKEKLGDKAGAIAAYRVAVESLASGVELTSMSGASTKSPYEAGSELNCTMYSANGQVPRSACGIVAAHLTDAAAARFCSNSLRACSRSRRWLPLRQATRLRLLCRSRVRLTNGPLSNVDWPSRFDGH